MKTKKKRFFCPKITVSLILGFLVFSQSKASSWIGGLPAVTSDGNYLSFCIIKNGCSELNILLTRKEQHYKCIPSGIKSTMGFSWRPDTSPQELTVFVNKDEGPMEICNLRISNGECSVISSWQVSPNEILGFPSWSPDGSILAARLTLLKDKSVFHNLALSFNGGRSLKTTSIAGGYVHWVTNEQLYLRNGEGIQLIEIVDRDAVVKKVVTKSDKANLVGVFQGQVIYSLNNKMYYGKHVIFKGINHLRNCAENDKYIFFIDGKDLIALNDEGDIVARWFVGENVKMMGTPYQSNFVYLQKNRKIVERYDIIPKVIYSLRPNK